MGKGRFAGSGRRISAIALDIDDRSKLYGPGVRLVAL